MLRRLWQRFSRNRLTSSPDFWTVESDEDVEALAASVVREAELWLETTDLIRESIIEDAEADPLPMLTKRIKEEKEKA